MVAVLAADLVVVLAVLLTAVLEIPPIADLLEAPLIVALAALVAVLAPQGAVLTAINLTALISAVLTRPILLIVMGI